MSAARSTCRQALQSSGLSTMTLATCFTRQEQDAGQRKWCSLQEVIPAGFAQPTRTALCHIRVQHAISSLKSQSRLSWRVHRIRVDYLSPCPDSGTVVGGGKWTFEHDRKAWYNSWEDSVQLPEVMPHFENLMQKTFLGWQDSTAKVDMV